VATFCISVLNVPDGAALAIDSIAGTSWPSIEIISDSVFGF